MLFDKGKYKKLFSFTLMFEKFSLSKQNMWKQNIKFFWFSGFPKSLLKWHFFKLEARKFNFPEYKKLIQNVFFSLFELVKLLPEISDRYEVRKFHFQKYNFFSLRDRKFHFLKSYVSQNIKNPFFENRRNLLILVLESSIFLKYKNFFLGGIFLFFGSWTPGECPRWLHNILLWLTKFYFHYKWNKAWLLVLTWFIRIASRVTKRLKI